jgi:hypothetical protein
MSSVLKKIFQGKTDEEVHSEFIKYGKGEFRDRYVIEGKKQKDAWKIKTSSEFANYFVKQGLGNYKGEIQIKGIIVSTNDISSDCKFEIGKVKKYMGISQFVIDTKIIPSVMFDLMEKYPRAFYALSFSYPEFELKVKAKPPKTGKPGKSADENPTADFCSLKTNNKKIIEDLFFDNSSFKECFIKHIVEINDIEIPKNIENPKEMREKSIRKGIMKRFAQFDGIKKESSKEFSA